MREYQDAAFERRSGRHCKGVPGWQRLGSVSHFTAARHTEEQVRGVPLLHSSISDESPTVLATRRRGT